MQEVNYETIKQKLENFYQNKCSFENIYYQLEGVDHPFSSLISLEENQMITELKCLSFENRETIFYEIENKDTKKKTNHILVYEIEENGIYPLFKTDYYQSMSNKVNYHKISYTTYMEHSNRICSRLTLSTLADQDFQNTRVSILDLKGKRDYMRKDYNLCLRGKEILSIQTDCNMHVIGEESFANRIGPIVRNIDHVSSKINHKLETLLESKIKIYEIKRK